MFGKTVLLYFIVLILFYIQYKYCLIIFVVWAIDVFDYIA